jgi:hypothetical protein
MYNAMDILCISFLHLPRKWYYGIFTVHTNAMADHANSQPDCLDRRLDVFVSAHKRPDYFGMPSAACSVYHDA